MKYHMSVVTNEWLDSSSSVVFLCEYVTGASDNFLCDFYVYFNLH